MYVGKHSQKQNSDSEYSYNAVYPHQVQEEMYTHLNGNKQWKWMPLLMTLE